MTINKGSKKYRFIPYILSFFIPAFIMAVAFWSLEIYPGGRNMVLTYDLRALYLPLYGYISDPGPGFSNLFHSMSGGLGGNIYATIVLCVSPLDVIYSFVPVRFLPDALYFMILFKIGLCGLCFCIFLNGNRKFNCPLLMTVLFSCCYALMSYNVMYYIAPMWYDAVMLLPLLALALEKIIERGKSTSFVILMTVCLISDYYIAYMVVIALVIYYLFRMSEERIKPKVFIKRTVSFALHGFLSVGMSMFVLIPAILDFNRGKLAEGDISLQGEFIKNSLYDVICSLKSQNYAGLDFNASPNIFCGTFVVILVLIWLILGRKNIRARITGALVIAFYFASFMIGPLDRAWHGFRDPVCFSVRYAFTFSFFMIVFAVRGIESLLDRQFKRFNANKNLIGVAACIITIFELFANAGFILGGIGTESGYTYSGEYYKFCDMFDSLLPMDELDDDRSYSRLVTSFRFSRYDGSLFGYDGLSRFSSSYNYNDSELFRKLGFGTIYHCFDEKGMTPPSIGLFDVGYIISFMVDQSDYYVPVEEHNGYTLYRNETGLPFAYVINSQIEESEFVEDPFSNINSVYEELFGHGEQRIDIFTNISTYPVPDPDITLTDDVRTVKSVGFDTVKSGHYYIFNEYKPENVDDDRLNDNESNGYNDHITIIRSYSLDGSYPEEYGNEQFSYCVDLGYLNEGEEHILTLESSNDEIGDIWVYYYNDDEYKAVSSEVKGFRIERIDKRGMVLKGNVDEESEVLVTLPYEDGYSVFIDGVKTDYHSYRDGLMVLTVGPGEHEVNIKYTPPGFGEGLTISIISAFIFCFLCAKNRISYHKNVENEENTES